MLCSLKAIIHTIIRKTFKNVKYYMGKIKHFFSAFPDGGEGGDVRCAFPEHLGKTKLFSNNFNGFVKYM